MDDFSPIIAASNSAWHAAQGEIDKMNQIDKTDTAAYSNAMLQTQVKMAIAASIEQKASSIIDKAFQAHSQVASK